MDQAVTTGNNVCVECMRITCKMCDWVASDAEILSIQQKQLKACPICGWKPKT